MIKRPYLPFQNMLKPKHCHHICCKVDHLQAMDYGPQCVLLPGRNKRLSNRDPSVRPGSPTSTLEASRTARGASSSVVNGAVSARCFRHSRTVSALWWGSASMA